MTPEVSPTGALLERNEELASVEDRLAVAASGRGGVLLVEGPAGIGKTRLLDAAREAAARRGFRVLVAGSSALERELAEQSGIRYPRHLGQVIGDVEAVDVLAGTEARLEHARALVELGALPRRSNHRTESREPLRAGLDLAGRLHASALRRQAVDELAAAGARPRDVHRTGVEALSPSERRVARLAADGHSDRDIAQALFVTTKTVEVHLSACYRKLGITSRAQLAALLD